MKICLIIRPAFNGGGQAPAEEPPAPEAEEVAVPPAEEAVAAAVAIGTAVSRPSVTSPAAPSSVGSKVFVTPPRLLEAEAPRVLIHCPQNAGCTAFALYLCDLLDAVCRPDTDCNEVVEWHVPRGVAYVHKATLSGHGEPDGPNPQLILASTPALTIILTLTLDPTLTLTLTLTPTLREY